MYLLFFAIDDACMEFIVMLCCKRVLLVFYTKALGTSEVCKYLVNV